MCWVSFNPCPCYQSFISHYRPCSLHFPPTQYFKQYFWVFCFCHLVNQEAGELDMNFELERAFLILCIVILISFALHKITKSATINKLIAISRDYYHFVLVGEFSCKAKELKAIKFFSQHNVSIKMYFSIPRLKTLNKSVRSKSLVVLSTCEMWPMDWW